jgi:endonuclease III
MRLFQEDLASEPFWMLVACVLVNKAPWSRASAVLDEVKYKWPNAADIASAEEAELAPVLRPLGFGNIRARNLTALGRAWIVAAPASAAEVYGLPGCGKYAADSWAIFVDGDSSVEPSDLKLLSYLSERDIRRAA